MPDEHRPLSVIVSGGDDRWGEGGADGARARGDGEATLLPIYLDPMTKLFLVALMWRRPWLLDPGAVTPAAGAPPEIAQWDALQATGAYHELPGSGSTATQRSGTGCPGGWPSTSRCCGTR